MFVKRLGDVPTFKLGMRNPTHAEGHISLTDEVRRDTNLDGTQHTLGVGGLTRSMTAARGRAE